MLSPISASTSLSAEFQFGRNQNRLFEVTQRLATGRRINAGKDDPAGLIAAERLSAEIDALQAENRMLQRMDANARIAEGSGAELSSLFADLNALVVAGSNQAGMSGAEMEANQMQIDRTVASIQRIGGAAITALEGVTLPDDGNTAVEALYSGALAAAVSVQSGGANDLSGGNPEAAQVALKAAATDVATARGRLGAYQTDTLGPRFRSNQVALENLTTSRSRIVDTDYARETGSAARLTVLVDAAGRTLRLAQQQAGSALDLLT